MEYKIKLKEDFIEELNDICSYLNFISKSSSLSKKLVLNINQNILRLITCPESYAIFNRKNRYGYEYRKMVVAKRYIVLYYIDYDDRIVYIAHIYDGRSNYTRKLV